ncbi:MAG TPA: aminotransferase class V-fold PLP-dependent enzyme [Bryobacteraceae bacterium]|nr:aminotransferase class V-fold PLP-dependent enzyme [Bryobacteraceae bacterium]
MDRRNFLNAAAGSALVAFQTNAIERAAAAARSVKDLTPLEVASDEDYWAEIRNAFTVDRTVVNLNNGYASPAPLVVQDAMRRYLDFSNMGPKHTMIDILEKQVEDARRRIAKAAGCDSEEIAITRNASESLENAQYGIDLKPGDEVLTTNQDYPRMLTTFRQRERREGIVLKMISFPVPPPSMDDLYQRFERAVTPKTKVILVCHITNRTGQIFPIRKICDMAHARNISVIVDGAHAFNHFPFNLSELGCDYYGVSLHKWTCAPIGTGFLYVRKSRIASTWSLMASSDRQQGDIRKFEEIGTHPAANHNAISAALIFNENIGIDRKAARLRYLRDRWAHRLAQNPKVKILHSPDPAQSCGIGFLAFNGVNSEKMAETLWSKYNIITVRVGSEEYDGLRITPHIYSTIGDIDYFAESVEKELKS